MQHSEEDCGAACLATVAKYYGRVLTLNRVREAVGTGAKGSSMLGLKRGAEVLGFYVRGLKVSPEFLLKLDKIPLPAIIHWKGTHWVVLYGQKGKHYIIADPAIGIRRLTEDELAYGWADWVMLQLTPDPRHFWQQEDDEIGNLGRFFVRILPYRFQLAEAIVCALLVGLFGLVIPFFIQVLTDDVLIRGDTRLVSTIAIVAIAIQVISSGLKLVQRNLVVQFAQRMQLGLVLEFAQQILKLPLSYYEARRSGEITSRLQDIQQINQLVAQAVVSLPSQMFIGTISLVVMLVYSIKLTAAAVVLAVLMFATTIIFLPTLRHKVRSLMVLETENQGVLVEVFKGALTLKTTGALSQFWDELQSRFAKLANFDLRTNQIEILNITSSELVANTGSIGLLWFGSFLVVGKEITIGQLLAFNAMNGNFWALISAVIGFIDEFVRVQTAVQRVSEVIDFPPEGQNEDKKNFEILSEQDDIVCNQLNFYYAGRVSLLSDFNLAILGGRVTALIGPSGCGKSTLAKLIAGLYKLQSGNIRIGSYNVEDLPLECLRRQVVLVPQEPHFWNRSIVANFRLGYPEVTLSQIVRACQIVEADEFIRELPDKYQTVLGEFGANISGGQRQRLAIARAIVTDPPILILDESTSGLDPVNEAQILDKLLRSRRGKTTILISHRPKVVARAEFIVMLEKGRLKIQGTQEELYSQDGIHLDFLVA
jgi:ATP-binding cassette subfamily C protein